jgi:hypothetical protein
MPSGRKGNKKVKTGCLICKYAIVPRQSVDGLLKHLKLTDIIRIRRVKCDEGKPNCQRCISTGRKCDGYEHLHTLGVVQSKSSQRSSADVMTEV